MDNTQKMMREKPVLKLLASMSVPAVLSMMIQSLYNIIDGIWVTKLGTSALTAVSLVYPLQNMIMGIGVGVGVGIGSLISRSSGSGDREKVDGAASTGLFLAIVHSMVFLLIGLFFTKPFYRLFTDDPQILAWACDYSYIVVCFAFGEFVQMTYEKIFQGPVSYTHLDVYKRQGHIWTSR